MDNYGFVVLRCVINEETNNYWNECIKRLNHFYPLRQIVIIDDNSNTEYLKSLYEHKNISVYPSIYPKRGELLPFLYFLKYHWFQKMIFIHDSCFFHKRITFEKLLCDIMPLWHFTPDNEQTNNTQSTQQNIQQNTQLDNSNLVTEIKKIKLGKLMVPRTTLIFTIILIALGVGLFFVTKPKSKSKRDDDYDDKREHNKK
jgi:hypothetical protein